MKLGRHSQDFARDILQTIAELSEAKRSHAARPKLLRAACSVLWFDAGRSFSERRREFAALWRLAGRLNQNLSTWPGSEWSIY